jgi:hypothetical protein
MRATSQWTVFFLVSIFCLPMFSQDASELKDSLYSKALVAGVAEMQKEWGYIDDGNHGTRIRTDYHRLIVRKNTEITNELPTQSDEFNFEYLDDASLLARYNKVKKGFSVLEIHPVHDKGVILRIQVDQNWVESHHGRLSIGISAWADVEFRYDCQQQAYLVSNVKLGGI